MGGGQVALSRIPGGAPRRETVFTGYRETETNKKSSRYVVGKRQLTRADTTRSWPRMNQVDTRWMWVWRVRASRGRDYAQFEKPFSSRSETSICHFCRANRCHLEEERKLSLGSWTEGRGQLQPVAG